MTDQIPRAQLGATTLLLHTVPDYGFPPRTIGEVATPLTDVPAQTTDETPAYRRMVFTVRVNGTATRQETAAANKVRLVHNIINEVAKDTNVLTLWRRGFTHPSVFRVVRNDRFGQPIDWLYDRKDVSIFAITLRTLPWCEADPATLAFYPSATATPCLLPVTIPGEIATPVAVDLEAAWTGDPFAGIRDARCALVPASTDLDDVLFSATGASLHAAFVAVADDNSRTGHCREMAETSWRGLVWGALPQGAYRVYVRARKRVSGAVSGVTDPEISLSRNRATPDTTPSGLVAGVATPGFSIVDLGGYESDGYTSLAIAARCPSGAAARLRVDWILAAPCDLGQPWGYVGDNSDCRGYGLEFPVRTPASGLSDVHNLHLGWTDDRTLTRVGGQVRSARRYACGSGGKAYGQAGLLVFASRWSGEAPTTDVHITATCTPRWWHWIPNDEEA